MVQALVVLDENTNRVLNTVKATYALKDKGQAIAFVVNHYIEEVNEPKLRPEYIKKIEKIRKEGKFTHFNSMDEFGAYFGLKKHAPTRRRR